MARWCGPVMMLSQSEYPSGSGQSNTEKHRERLSELKSVGVTLSELIKALLNAN